ncbi:MAG TPA: endonuclease/exonuclease/phosphatase family protein [Kofleriaceae bacterium]|nr:endonuclease/exonuclease/phosphatase family protein [Kofleriaceae bacterium]
MAIVGCANRGTPADGSIETTFPTKSLATSLPRQLRVVTFNVHMETATRVLEGLRNDRALEHADLIVLQEVMRFDDAVPCSVACAIGKELGFHAIFAPGHAMGKGSLGVAIVSRAPITSAQVLELPYFNVHFNSGRRVAIAATLDVDSAPVTVYAVHLDNRLTITDRKKQMTPVLEHARRQHTPVIIAGDLNTSHFTWLAHVIPVPITTQDNRMEQLVRSYGFETPCHDSGPTHRYLGMKLDAIYTRGFDTVRFATADAKNVSDHLALWAVLHPSAPPRTLAAR